MAGKYDKFLSKYRETDLTLTEADARYLQLTPSSDTDNVIQPTGDFKNLVLKTVAGQTKLPFSVTDENDVLKASISPAGAGYFAGNITSDGSSLSVNNGLLTVNQGTGYTQFIYEPEDNNKTAFFRVTPQGSPTYTYAGLYPKSWFSLTGSDFNPAEGSTASLDFMVTNDMNYIFSRAYGTAALQDIRFATLSGTTVGLQMMTLQVATGNVGINITAPTAQLHIVSGAVDRIGLKVQGAASQTANLQEWLNSAGTIGMSISPTFRLTVGQSDSIVYADGSAPSGRPIQLDNTANKTGSTCALAFRVNNDAGSIQRGYISLIAGANAYDQSLVYTQRTGASTYTERLRIDGNGNLLLTGNLTAGGYKSSDGSDGATATPGGATFKNGLYISGDILMKNIYLLAENQSEGNLTLSNATWGATKSFIESIKVETSSTDWDMWLCETSAFDKTLITTRQIAANRNGNYDITISRTYNSDATNVYLIYTDNSGTNTADILISGEERR